MNLPSISTSSASGVLGSVGRSAILFTNTIPLIPLETAISSRPEVPGTAVSPSKGLVFPSFVSLTVSATSGASSTLEYPGYAIVPSPTSAPGSPREEIISNATSSIIPVYTAALLGNAYGGGFVGTPSVYVTKLPYPNGPSSGVPPGYGSESSITIIGNNITTVLTGLEGSSTTAGGLQSTIAIQTSASAAIIATNASVIFGSLGASAISATASGNEGSTPTFTSLSPFGGEIGQESNSLTVPSVISIEVPSSLSSGAIFVTALIAATSPTAALSAEISEVSNAVLSSLAAASLSTPSVNVQVAVVGSSTTSIIGPSGETAGSSFPASALVGGTAILSTVATVSPLGAAPPNLQVITAAENSGSSSTSAIGLPGVVEASIVPATTVAGVVLSSTFSSTSVNIEATPAGSPAEGEIGATVLPSLPAEQSAGPVVTLAVGPSAEQAPAAGQSAASVPIPIIAANSTAALGVIPSPVVAANGQIPPAGQPAASTPTSIIVANGSTALAVVPTPVIGANGLTSLAVFSTPIAAAAGLTTPAVLLTPIVGANGLTSLAVVATPVIGANGLTSLAIGFETETTPAAGQSNSARTPVEGFIVVQSPAFTPQASSGIPVQASIISSGVANGVVPSGFPGSPVSGGSGSSNYSIHVPLSPTAATQFQGSASRLSLGFEVGLFGSFVFLILL